jgi:hypothetical protein
VALFQIYTTNQGDDTMNATGTYLGVCWSKINGEYFVDRFPDAPSFSSESLLRRFVDRNISTLMRFGLCGWWHRNGRDN